MGVAEANMVGASAGLALSGKIPFAYSIVPFLIARCYDQIRMDVCYHRTNVKLVGVGGGFAYGNQGATHHAIEDVAVLRALPNMTVVCPCDPLEAGKATKAAAAYPGPVYIRLWRQDEPAVYQSDYEFTIGKAISLRKGTDVTLIATGVVVRFALQAADLLQAKGIKAGVINMHTVKPLDIEAVLSAAQQSGAIVTIEEHSIIGGLGSAVAEVLMESSLRRIRFKRLGVQDVFSEETEDTDHLYLRHHLTPPQIAEAAHDLIRSSGGD